ncbi:MHS family MFS transporter (plasmid) [Rhizobium sp. WL3]|uniref:MFS transporter n=1 Tax=Rhizobium sp. WL3 TaxID=2603277 RepID=UPI0011C1FF7A|nr:MHS family MFS transporter [Rhizobium sp. WL3]
MLDAQPRMHRLLALSGIGGALEFFDFVIFLFLASEISANFFPPDTPAWVADVQTLGIFAAGYVFRPLGGIVMAHVGDRYGRKRVFLFSILLMALSTFGIALVPNYAQIGWLAPLSLLLLRSLQGAAIGGEAPGAWTFVSEHVPARNLALACAFMSASLIAGVLLASLVTMAAQSAFTPAAMLDYGWRVPFAVAGSLGLLGAILRHWLSETPVFLRARAERHRSEPLPLAVVLRSHRAALCISVAATWTLSAVVIVTTLMTPFILQRQYGFEPGASLALSAFGIPFLCVGALFAGVMSDRFGIGLYLMLASLPFAAANLLFYSDLAPENGHTQLLLALASFFNGIVGVNACLMVRAFPSNVRFTGISLAYNVAFAISGGLTPVAMASIFPTEPMVHVYYLLLIATGIGILGAYVTRNPGVIRYGQGRDEKPLPAKAVH